MSIRQLSAAALFGVLALGAVAVTAQDFTPPSSPEEAVTMRKDLMRANGGLLRSAGQLTGDEAVAAMTTLRDNYNHYLVLFPEGSIVGESEALPAIWENWAAFEGIIDTGVAAAEAGITAAQAGDAAGYTAAVQAIGQTCGQCHQQFRG